MNQAIVVELHFFGTSVLWGVLILILYDFLRIFRRLVSHNNFFVALEDLLYWMVSSVLIFRMMYQQNNGIIRGFSIMGMLLGMLIYHGTISDLCVTFISSFLLRIENLIKRIVLFILSPFCFLFKLIKNLVLRIIRLMKKFTSFLSKSLKKKKKSGKIALSNDEECD
ncbi:spore cortex biosynthesis protein YabQ [Anaerocolumna cellulosilytica]|uniref:spore cortex biosynthesis protein YabQ n=1 Tax=Anaerocolumna cellulosilytica TaxID=433286 RepID=UPI001607F8C1|nr:spore cortex biosynthesis protein YabQ [Anaerocolumna cellulosilytica]MBB5196960.1 spore cortex biosynthesis protein YabQ [Anaerocolumna cellulosilytica]